MNKQEALKQIEELEAKHAEEINKLKAIIETPDTSELVFKPMENGVYYHIWGSGTINNIPNLNTAHDRVMQEKGNCFRNKEDAKASAKYYIMNSEHDYWFPWTGQPKPKVLPKGLEFWFGATGKWHASCVKTVDELDVRSPYRWKRSDQIK